MALLLPFAPSGIWCGCFMITVHKKKKKAIVLGWVNRYSSSVTVWRPRHFSSAATALPMCSRRHTALPISHFTYRRDRRMFSVDEMDEIGSTSPDASGSLNLQDCIFPEGATINEITFWRERSLPICMHWLFSTTESHVFEKRSNARFGFGIIVGNSAAMVFRSRMAYALAKLWLLFGNRWKTCRTYLWCKATQAEPVWKVLCKRKNTASVRVGDVHFAPVRFLFGRI